MTEHPHPASEGLLEAGAPVPSGLQHERFLATPLTTSVAALDHAAYLASPDVIRVHSDGRWPVEGLTLAHDLELVAGHQADHESNRAFTFTLLDHARTESLGCLYLNPLRSYLRRIGAEEQLIDAVPPTAAMVTFWIRQDQQGTGLPDEVARGVDQWLREDWPLAWYTFRVLPEEHTSRRALDRLDLARVDLSPPEEHRPYLWYRGAGQE